MNLILFWCYLIPRILTARYAMAIRAVKRAGATTYKANKGGV